MKIDNFLKMRKKTLFINTWSSICGNCNIDTDGDKKSCEILLGYGEQNGTKGCGAKWKYLSSQYGEDVIPSERLKEMRPDLIINRQII